MKTRLNQILTRTASETLEQLAFVFSFPAPETEPPAGEPTVRVRVGFSGPFSGLLQMAVSEDCLTEISANMLGIEEEETSEEQKSDAVKEAINVVCGNLLPAVAGQTAVFDLAAPEMIFDEEEKTVGGLGLHCVSEASLELEEGRCTLALFVDDPDLLSSCLAGVAAEKER